MSVFSALRLVHSHQHPWVSETENMSSELRNTASKYDISFTANSKIGSWLLCDTFFVNLALPSRLARIDISRLSLCMVSLFVYNAT